MIDTRTVQGRRPLRFETLDEMVADARACAAAPGLRRLGNWTLGQALNHIAAWIEYPFVGYPVELVFPEEVRAQARASLPRILASPMQPAERIVDNAAGTLATEVVPDAAGLARLEAAVGLLRSGAPDRPTPRPDPAFGVVTHHEWTQMTLRHAELHLSFFVGR